MGSEMCIRDSSITLVSVCSVLVGWFIGILMSSRGFGTTGNIVLGLTSVILLIFFISSIDLINNVSQAVSLASSSLPEQI